MKSSRDVLQDPKLSSQPVVESTAAMLKVTISQVFSDPAA